MEEERDATGLKGGLTEKVSMGDEFKRFQQKKTVEAAKVLLEKITLYEKQLRDKHSKEKYYAKLLNIVQEQKAAVEAGIRQAEQPQTPKTNAPQPKQTTVDDVDMDALVDEVIEREKQHARQYEDTTGGDPNVPSFPGEARRVYLKLTKEFPGIERELKSERAAITDLLQKCKALQANPNLRAKPDSALAVAQKVFETLEKIEAKAADLQSDFLTEAHVVRKELGPRPARPKNSTSSPAA